MNMEMIFLFEDALLLGGLVLEVFYCSTDDGVTSSLISKSSGVSMIAV